jgi:hypothetical protein
VAATICTATVLSSMSRRSTGGAKFRNTEVSDTEVWNTEVWTNEVFLPSKDKENQPSSMTPRNVASCSLSKNARFQLVIGGVVSGKIHQHMVNLAYAPRDLVDHTLVLSLRTIVASDFLKLRLWYEGLEHPDNRDSSRVRFQNTHG